MARYLTKIQSSRSIYETFDYLADFSTTEIWDPSVTNAERTSDGPLGKSSTFEVSVAFFGPTTTFPYRIVEYERPYRVVLIGETATVLSHDEITIVPLRSGCQVIYDAEVTIKGPRIAQPAIAVADLGLSGLFNWSAARSAQGLEQALSRTCQAPTHLRAVG